MTVVYEGAVSTGEVGGARVHFGGMARALDARLGGRLIVVTPRFLGEEELQIDLPAGAHRRALPTLRPGLTGHAMYELVKAGYLVGVRLRDLVRRRPTIVVSRITPVGVAPLVTRLLGVRTAIEVNGVPDAEFESRGFSRAVVRAVRLVTTLQLRLAYRVIAVTERTADVCRDRTSSPVMRLENGVDLDAVPIAAAIGQPGSPNTVAYSGAFAPWHDLDTLVRAVAARPSGESGVGRRLLLIGDGEQRSHLEALADELGVADRVEITGWLERTEAARRLLEARVAVVSMAPRSENGISGSPLKLFEYLALGRSVVASDVDGVVELDDYPITLYRCGDAAALGEAIERASRQRLTGDEVRLLRSRLSWHDRCARLLEFVGVAEDDHGPGSPR